MTHRGRGHRALALAWCSRLVAACSTDRADEDAEPVAWEFTSCTDLTPPLIEVTTAEAGADLVFLGVKDQRDKGAPMNGPVIVDADGAPVWIAPQGDIRWTYDLRVQRYRGEPALSGGGATPTSSGTESSW